MSWKSTERKSWDQRVKCDKNVGAFIISINYARWLRNASRVYHLFMRSKRLRKIVNRAYCMHIARFILLKCLDGRGSSWKNNTYKKLDFSVQRRLRYVMSSKAITVRLKEVLIAKYFKSGPWCNRLLTSTTNYHFASSFLSLSLFLFLFWSFQTYLIHWEKMK